MCGRLSLTCAPVSGRRILPATNRSIGLPQLVMAPGGLRVEFQALQQCGFLLRIFLGLIEYGT